MYGKLGNLGIALGVAGLLALSPPAAVACEKMKDEAKDVAAATWAGAKADWETQALLYMGKGTGASGMKAFVDPDTGALRAPSADESAAMSLGGESTFAAGSQPLVLRRFSNGTMSVVLTPDYLDASVATLNPDGTLSMGCVKGLDRAATATQAGQVANQLPSAPEEK